MLLAFFFPALFPSLSACVAGLVLPACVSVQSGFSSLLSLFLQSKERSCHFHLQKLQRPRLLALDLLFCSELGNTAAFSQQRAFDGDGDGCRTWNFTRTTTWRENFCLETTQRLFLLPTCSGKQALDDDALGGIWDGVVEEKRKGSEKESGGRRGSLSLAAFCLLGSWD